MPGRRPLRPGGLGRQCPRGHRLTIVRDLATVPGSTWRRRSQSRPGSGLLSRRLVGANGGKNELDDGIKRDRSGVDDQVIQGRVARVDAVEPADVGATGSVSRTQAYPGLLLADALDHGALGDAAAWRAVQPDVEAAVLAEHDRRSPAQDHPAAGAKQPVDPGLAVYPQVV